MRLLNRTRFPGPSLLIRIKFQGDHEMEILAPTVLRHKSELCDAGIHLLHLGIFRGNRSHTLAEFAVVIYPAEFLPLGPFTVAAEANSRPAALSESPVDLFLDVARSGLFDGLENDFLQECDGLPGHIFPVREEDVACERPVDWAPVIVSEVQLRHDPEWFSMLAMKSVSGMQRELAQRNLISVCCLGFRSVKICAKGHKSFAEAGRE